MFDEPDEQPAEDASDPLTRAREKSDEFRMHAEIAAVFEGARKFDAQIETNLDLDIAREVQKTIAKLEKSKIENTPVISEASMPEAARLLKLHREHNLATNAYNIHRRPGEVMIVRWLEGEQVDSFYERLQAHFNAAMNAFREEERQQNAWKQEPATLKYLEALDALDIKMEERYLRNVIRQHRVFVLSTQTADEIDILYLCDYMMGVEAEQIVGRASAPPEQPTEADRAWFFKLFSLRGIDEGVERMCFFAFLQKAEDTFEESW